MLKNGKQDRLFVIFSKDSMNLFPNNNGASFRVLIPPHFSRQWEIGLRQVYIKMMPHTPAKHILICSEQIIKSMCSNSEFAILRSVYLDKRIVNYEFKHTYYFKFNQYNIEYLHIYLTYENMEQIPELRYYVKCVMHCIKI